MRAVFVAGAHTDVGKTWAACALIRTARGQGLRVEAVKPVVSGFDEAGWAESDPGRLLTALGRHHAPAMLEALSPWRFSAPLAPPMAAKLEGRSLDIDEIAAYCRERMARTGADLVVVEGVGGVMSPLTETATGLELTQALGAPSILVGGSYLGAISHTLTALEVMRGRALPVTAVVVSESGDPEAPDFAETVASIGRFAGDTPVLAAARGEDRRWAEAVLNRLIPR
jgi:dethiobiotin synthetase